MEVTRSESSAVRFSVTGTGIEVEFAPGVPVRQNLESIASTEVRPGRPREHTIQTLPAASGSVPLQLDPRSAKGRFPHLVERVPAGQLAALIATTTIVGMECPGLYSAFSELDVKFTGDAIAGPLNYRVKTFDRRFQLATILLDAAGVTGSLKAFLRPPPQQQRGFSELAAHVTAGEFSGRRALVVGGSRGLGEVTAKLLAAGGADVRLTYHRGAGDAQKVVEEIRSGGGTAESMPLDVTNPHVPTDYAPTDLYYLATPFIFGATARTFQEPIFRTFCDYYVTGFQNLVRQLPGLKRVFYPSSTAVEELPPNMFEYAAAKMAGESVARFLAKHNPGLTVRCTRLPRLATDQTATVMPVENKDPVQVILAELRALSTV
jgi:NADP-dependent 3-hydroxy acid dehydrogenase YdfG